jgi:hypothetical protein
VRAADAQRSAVSITPMRFQSTIRPLFLIALTWASAPGQATSQRSLEISRRNPDGWFTLDVPRVIGDVQRHADVDGGFYVSDNLEVDYNYWTYANTPNWLRGKYATSLLLACSGKNKNTRTLRARIDGKRAVTQQCSQTDERKGFRYIYYVTFPKLRVFDGERFHYGMFNLRVEYRNPRTLSAARQIVRSLDFER